MSVLERAGRVGGKCWSIPLPTNDGKHNRVIETGAVEVTPAYPSVLEIAREVGASMQVEPPRGTANLGRDQIVWNAQALLGPYTREQVAVAAVLYYAYVSYVYHDYVSAPGMAGPIGAGGVPEGIPAELCAPMSKWLESTSLQPLSGLFDYAATIYGYGDMEHTPAAYMLRYMESKNFGMVLVNMLEDLAHFESVWPKNFTLGYQNLWDRVAAKLNNVQLNTAIRGITRGDKITVTFDDGSKKVFDKLIVTCCLDRSLPDLINDLTEAEKGLFAKTVYTDYYTTAVGVKSFPDSGKPPPGSVSSGSYGEIPLPAVGHAWGVFKTWDDVGAAVYYSVGVPKGAGSESINGETIYKLIEEDARKLHYRVGPIIETDGVKLQKQWSYFPHVESAGINNHYLALEKLQGQNNTFYSGGLLSFETVHNVVTYSKGLVERWFPSCPGLRQD